MKLAVFGATGGVGRQVVQQALRARHSVRVLVRAPGRAAFPPAVEIVAGNVLNAKAVSDAIGDADAVLSCLGAKITATFTRQGRVVAPGMAEIIEAMYWHGVRRLIAISTYGAGGSWPHLSLGARFMMRTLLRGELADKNAMEAAIRASHLDWTIVRPVNLKNGPPSGRAVADAPDELAIGEGVETMLTARHILGVPSWAALTADNLSRFTGVPSIQRLIIVVDNDLAGARAAEALRERATANVRVEMTSAPEGFNDLNDWARGNAQA